MIPRLLEPEAMDTPEEARSYDDMDHSEVNQRFVADFLAAHGPTRGGTILDLGTGTARIPIALATADLGARVLAVDMAGHMLAIAGRNVINAGLSDRVALQRADAKRLPFPSAGFEAVVSNSLVHHIPEPAAVFAELARLVAPGGTLFVRDLARPESWQDVEKLVSHYAGNEPAAAQAMFRASLHAALTLAEVQGLIRGAGLDPQDAAMTSDRHWTWVWNRA